MSKLKVSHCFTILLQANAKIWHANEKLRGGTLTFHEQKQINLNIFFPPMSLSGLHIWTLPLLSVVNSHSESKMLTRTH